MSCTAINRKTFFDEYRRVIDKDNKLSQGEVEALDEFLDFMEEDINYFTIPQWAYVYATVFHETGFTFLPLREAPRLSEAWRKRNFRYYPYYGRGYVQLTWLANYKLFTKLLNIDLVNNPDLAMVPRTAFKILVYGFKNGSFTGKKISDYISGTKVDYLNARRCINIMDKASTIASYAESFEKLLTKSMNLK